MLCSHLARFVQEQIDTYAKYHQNFPPPSNRPRGALYIVDRSMDLHSPLVHEFTYQAMAHDLLPIKEGDKVTYKTVINEGEPDQEEKDMELGEKDKIWVENRHTHMKDTIEKIMADFKRFIDENPHFTKADADSTNLNTIKDMIAGLPQFQEQKGSYSLHLAMAQDCMNVFQRCKLMDIASVEQVSCGRPAPLGLILMSFFEVPGHELGRRLPQTEEHGRSASSASRRGKCQPS